MADLPSGEASRAQRSSVRGERCPNCGQPLVLGQCTFCGYRPGVTTTPTPAAPPPTTPGEAPSPTAPNEAGAAPSTPTPAGPAPKPLFTPAGSTTSTVGAPPPPRPANANAAGANNPWIVGLACVS